MGNKINIWFTKNQLANLDLRRSNDIADDEDEVRREELMADLADRNEFYPTAAC